MSKQGRHAKRHRNNSVVVKDNKDYVGKHRKEDAK